MVKIFKILLVTLKNCSDLSISHYSTYLMKEKKDSLEKRQTEKNITSGIKKN